MTASRLAVRLSAALVLTIGGLWLHELIQTQAGPTLVSGSWLDHRLPFMPWTIWIYLAFFPLIGWTALAVEPVRFWRFVVAATLAALIAWSIVLSFPITFDRPDPASMSAGLHRDVFALIHHLDTSHISFPSLHVAVTWLCYAMLWSQPGRAWRLPLCAAVSLSTLTTKQHLVIDVLAGVALAALCLWMTRCMGMARKGAYSRPVRAVGE